MASHHQAAPQVEQFIEALSQDPRAQNPLYGYSIDRTLAQKLVQDSEAVLDAGDLLMLSETYFDLARGDHELVLNISGNPTVTPLERTGWAAPTIEEVNSNPLPLEEVDE